MRRVIPVLAAALVTLVPFVSRAEVTDRIVAVVNDEIVTLREVQKYVKVEKRSPYASMNEYTNSEEIRDKLDSFIENLLLGQQAQKMKIEVTDREVQDTIDNIKKTNLITDAELRQQLKKDNIDYDEFRDGIKKSIIRQKVVGRAVTLEVSISEKTLEDYYQAHKGDYVREEYHLQHIFISSQRADGNKRAQQALQALQDGTSFEEAAKEFSDDASNASGGDMGFVSKDELIPELREAIKLLIPGTNSGVVRTSFGYHIMKLIETRRGETAPYESIKENIRNRLFQIESEKMYRSYIAKLRAASFIEVKI